MVVVVGFPACVMLRFRIRVTQRARNRADMVDLIGSVKIGKLFLQIRYKSLRRQGLCFPIFNYPRLLRWEVILDPSIVLVRHELCPII